MAVYRGGMAVRKHGTLTQSVVASVDVEREIVEILIPSTTTGNNTTKWTGGGIREVEVLSRGNNEIFFTVDGSTPSVAGDDTYVAMAHIPARVPVDRTGKVTVKMISSAAADYTVSAV